jgi:hypothetical protein
MGLQLNISGETAHRGALTIRGEVLGLDQLAAACRAIAERAPVAIAGAFTREMHSILTDAKTISPRVPVGSPPEDKHPGTLRASAHVEAPVIVGNVVTVRGGFGGAAIKYALAQHERLDYRHPHAGEGAKYLETHVLRRAVTMDARLAADVGGPTFAKVATFVSTTASVAESAFYHGMLRARMKGWRTLHGDY